MSTVHRLDVTGEDTNIYRLARELLASGADPGDRIETYRGATPCLSGVVGRLAKWTLMENKRGNPTFAFVRYQPFVPWQAAKSHNVGSPMR